MGDEWLDKDIVVQRSKDGNLIPITETVEFLSGQPKVKLLPMTRREFKELSANKDVDKDEELIISHYVLPRFTKEDFASMSPKDINALAWCLMSASTGFAQTYFKDKTMSAITAAMDGEYALKNRV